MFPPLNHYLHFYNPIKKKKNKYKFSIIITLRNIINYFLQNVLLIT